MVVSVLVMVRIAGLVRARSRAGAYDRVLAAAAEVLLAAPDTEVPAITESAAGTLLGLGSSDQAGAARVWMFAEGDGHGGIPVGALAALDAGRVWLATGPAPFLPGAPATSCVLVAPLTIGRELRGLVAAPLGDDADDEATQAFGRLAREAALALERSELIAETERRAGERRFKALVEHSRDVVLQLDGDDRVRFATPAALQVFGLSDDRIVGVALPSLVEAEHAGLVAHFLADARRAGARSPIEVRVCHAHHGPLWCELVATDLTDEPTVASLVVTARTIDERKAAEQRLSRSEARFRSLVQHSSDVVAVIDSDFVVGYASPSISRVLGHPHDELIDRDFLQLVHPEDRAGLVQLTDRLDPTGDRPSRLELRVRDDRDSWRTLDVTASDLRAYPAVQGIVLNAHDVSERKELELDLARQAMFDDLTGLANRLLFRQTLSDALERPRDGQSTVAVLFLDLNEFKTVNDSMGHAIGDDLLAIVGRRLAGLMRATDTAARLGGDEFAMLVVSADREDALRVAQRVQTALSAPMSVGGREITVAGSVGVAYADGPDSSIGDLLRNADTAMYVAKRRGSSNQIEVFDPSMLASVRERLDLMNDLGRALERDELVLYYQPVVDLRTGQVKGFEALTRWQHPTRGMVAPASFVPLAEEIGLILPMTEWVLDRALAQVAAWNADRPAGAKLSMSVNLSGRHIEVDGAGAMVEAALRRHGVEPGLVVVELTEGLAVDFESDDVRRRLEAVTGLGVHLAADDFGAGFASYANLQRLPYSVVKVDRSVINGLDTHEERARLQIRSIIEMAHGAGMTVVAEGIEGAEQLQALRELGCDAGQGYYFARPMPADEATSLSFEVPSAA
jgi:diguanylate cyclase (GGDEF)-like protein/PAS domain S-box-containing protein